MKKVLFTSLIILIGYSVFAQTHLYENPDFDRIARTHQIIGIIPFNATVKLRPKQMKDMTPEQLMQMEEAEGRGIQSAMYSWFLKRKKRGKLTVDVQDPLTTSAKLAKAGITTQNIVEYTPGELAKIIGVDAVVMGQFNTNKPMSEGAAVVLGALFDVWGATNKAIINLFIYNAEDGAMLVNYNKSVSGSMGSSTEDLVNVLMRKASRRIAYTK